MPPSALLTSLTALLLAAIGFHVAFRQRTVRRLWASFRGLRPAPRRMPEDDPAPYAMIIAGTMLMAFGVILFAFNTVYAFAS